MQTCTRSPALIGAFDWSYSGIRLRRNFCYKSLLPWFLDHLIRVIYRFSQGKSKTLFNIHNLFKQNINYDRVMLKRRWKQRERLKTTTLHVQHTFLLYISLPLCHPLSGLPCNINFFKLHYVFIYWLSISQSAH